ncbi:hypothetical protein XENORESO_019355 [Xenotaenia resolanae]|uniref:Uncharacterized protein n=1 Tax=Xenotaenia resolanae TaxID=208358 RepID=A0ABV0XA56_9TELE
MPNHTRTHGAEPTERPGTGTQTQPGKQGNKTRPTQTLRPPTRNPRPKMAGPPKCKLRASIGTCTPHIQKNRDPKGQPTSRVKQTPRCTTPPTTVPKEKTPAQQAEGQHKKATARTAKRSHSHSRHRTTNIHASQAKTSQASPRFLLSNTTAPPHILPYIGRGTVKTTNPKHTPPTRNHPADK